MPTPFNRYLRRACRVVSLFSLLAWAPHGTGAEVVRTEPAAPGCGVASAPPRVLPPLASPAIPDSRVAVGARDIRLAWLAAPTSRYGHAALGSRVHAAELQVRVGDGEAARTLRYRLPDDRVFEDRVPRLADLDGDGRDEVVLVEAQEDEGAALVVLGVEGSGPAARVVERARGERVGRMRWLNPVGFADFDGDGRAELASVRTPHIGGVLTLQAYAPPRLVMLGELPGVANHQMGSVEQQLAVIVARRGAGPLVLVPDPTYRSLHALQWQPGVGWQAAAALATLPSPALRMLPVPGGACIGLEDGRSLRASVTGARAVLQVP